MRLRIQVGRELRGGTRRPGYAIVEWAGQVGHPSSYGLLGGALSDVPRISLQDSGAHFREALAATADDVRWGLPSEYREAVLALLSDQPQPVTISRSAYGVVGSSVLAFRSVALLLCRVLASGLPRSDQDVWKLRDQCWNSAG